ncbi:MAG: hypothetical protein U9Q81_02885 [Pseudomonadota bacterium]|nr:hypothetical protein [Pseudomonadota bacterium]
MKQRPKLSLSPAQESDKTQPQGFSADVANGSSASTKNLGGDQPPAAHEPESTEAVTGTVSKHPNWLNAATIVKTLLVVGIAALSIVLLKRRLL